ncbi:MAG: peptidoglycan DD-metalloendopeptidase family protein [Pseudomonadota bacterium]
MVGKAAVLLAFLFFPAAWGASQVEERSKNLKKYQEQIDRQRERLRGVVKREVSLHQELQRISSRMEQLNTEIAGLEKEQALLDSRIRGASEEIQGMGTEIKAQESAVAAVLRRLYMEGRPSYLKALLQSDSTEDFRRRQFLVKAFVEFDEKVVEVYRARVDALSSRKIRYENDFSQRKRVREELGARRVQLAGQRSDRADLLALVKNQKDYYEKNIREMEKAAKDLQQLIETLQRSRVTENVVFARLRGQLPLPVPGALERKFGAYRDPKVSVQLYYKGIDLKAEDGAPVRAVYDGKVAYADWFVGYGKIIILDHGGGYFTLCAHLKDILKPVGSDVVAGEPIGHVGDTGSLKGSYLYFELRYKGISQDPWPWFAASSRK